MANNISITLNDDEQKALIQLLDQANRYSGIQNAETVVFFLKKLQEAAQAKDRPPLVEK